MSQSVKLKKAIAQGNVTVMNKTSGEVCVFLVNAKGESIQVYIPPKGKKELAPKLCPIANIALSRNLGNLLLGGHLRLLSK